MTLPEILVVDDQFARDPTERAVFLHSVGCAGASHAGDSSRRLFASFEFCSGQREYVGRVENDYRVVRSAVAHGRWACVLLDLQFDSGVIGVDGQVSCQSGDERFGVEVRDRLRSEFPGLPVVMLTGRKQQEMEWAVTPYLSKHKLNARELKLTLLRYGRVEAAERRELLELNADICAASPAMLAAFQEVYAHSASDVSVLIIGETGTGKEVVARYLHRISPRNAGPFVALNVAAIPSSLVEAELFGIGKDVATGVRAKVGKLELASGGTLFLDEIGDMPSDVQSKVLRALQERKIVRVGESQEIPVDIRVVCATSRDLARQASSGEFRRDLLYRINTVAVSLPPLRDRREDIFPLANSFLRRFAAVQGKTGLSFDRSAAVLLEAQRFAGNVRELEHLVERLVSSTGHHQVIFAAAIAEALGGLGKPLAESGSGAPLTCAPTSPTDDMRVGTTLERLLVELEQFCPSADDPALKGAATRLDAASARLRLLLAGAALERCRNPNSQALNRQLAMRLLTGDSTLAGKGPSRILNDIQGRRQQDPVREEDMERIVALWRKGGGPCV